MNGAFGTFPYGLPPGVQVPPGPAPAGIPAGGGACGVTRTVLAGGAFQNQLVHPEIIPFERLYRILPDEGMFLEQVTPEQPFTATLGSFRVPGRQTLIVTDFRPDIYRFSGVSAGDTVPVEARRFGSIMGYDITIDGRHPGNLEMQIDPVLITQPQVFAQIQGLNVENFALLASMGVPPFARYDAAASTSFGSTAGAGQSLLPQRPTRYGPLSMPFSLYVKSDSIIEVRVVIFHPIPSPIAWIEADLAGMLVPSLWIESLTECAKPLTQASGGPGSLGPGPR